MNGILGRRQPLLYHEPQCYAYDNRCHCSNGAHYRLPPEPPLPSRNRESNLSPSSAPPLSVNMSAEDVRRLYSAIPSGDEEEHSFEASCPAYVEEEEHKPRGTVTHSCPDYTEMEETPSCPSQIEEEEGGMSTHVTVSSEPALTEEGTSCPDPPSSYYDTSFLPVCALVLPRMQKRPSSSSTSEDLPPSYESLYPERARNTTPEAHRQEKRTVSSKLGKFFFRNK